MKEGGGEKIEREKTPNILNSCEEYWGGGYICYNGVGKKKLQQKNHTTAMDLYAAVSIGTI